MNKNVQIPQNVKIPKSLFIDLIRYFALNSDEPELFGRIKEQLDEKIEKIIARQLFTEYKAAENDAEREKARQEYLDYVGISEAFRSPSEVKNEDL